MKSLITITTILISLIIMSSCSKESDVVYSCDKNVNEFVKSNLRQISDISYDSLISYEIEYQKAIFRSLSIDKKYSLWVEKFNRTLLLEWSTSERGHINELKDSLNVNWYDININQALELQRDNYLNAWRLRGVDNIGFDDRMLYSIAGRIDIIVNPDEPASMMQTEHGGSSIGVGDPQSDCNCSRSSDWCWGSTDCLQEKCSQTAHGCGTVWTYKCSGNCGADI